MQNYTVTLVNKENITDVLSKILLATCFNDAANSALIEIEAADPTKSYVVTNVMLTSEPQQPDVYNFMFELKKDLADESTDCCMTVIAKNIEQAVERFNMNPESKLADGALLAKIECIGKLLTELNVSYTIDFYLGAGKCQTLFATSKNVLAQDKFDAIKIVKNKLESNEFISSGYLTYTIGGVTAV